NLAKITSELVEVWARILNRVPTARLMLKNVGLGDEPVQQRFRDLFARHGVAPERLLMFPPTPFADYLATYQRIDLVLDPFPFGGSATTCDALWMGVPVITKPGDTFASRHGLTHLRTIGVTETIARDVDDYVELTVAWANDLPRLAELRACLRARM